ncbi:hypothetical protein CVT24_004446 [Panaeolus cyanescens]|uniref:Uncharacterized protein n=1 Tax=Panaeolus cyanescens TaxID=181874 RepID=A0A409YBK0_9AGAR|nr:hypothetical protein CVT24_004446 [Panaeolus cyanescens]
MWDTIHRAEAMKRAAVHLEQLQNGVWKDNIEKGSKISRFENCQTSAIAIMKATYYRDIWVGNLFYLQSITYLVFAELLERIENSRQQRRTLLEDRTHLLAHPNHELDATLRSLLRDLDGQLTAHIRQLHSFGSSPPGFDVNIQSVTYQCLLDITLASEQFVHAIERRLARPTRSASLPSAWMHRIALRTAL